MGGGGEILFNNICNTHSGYFEIEYSECVLEYFITIVFPKCFKYCTKKKDFKYF